MQMTQEGSSMQRRQESIIYQLAASDGPLTAEELAKRLLVSTRTIKYEMIEVKTKLFEVGAELIAKRNEGYSIRITDQNLFNQYLEPIGIQSTLANNFGSDDHARFLYIARKLVSSSRFVKLEDIADELYLSRSAIREDVNHVMDFLRSYHLEVESKPGLGVRAFGTEYHMRMAMTELYAVHFHKVLLDNAGMEYTKWMECGYEERQDIRHVFLKELRETDVKISDINTQRLSIYFIIVRNRCNAGYRLRLPDHWKKKVGTSKEFYAANAIYENLKSQFLGYDLPEEETIFLAVYLMSGRDMWNVTQPEQEYAPFYREACEIQAGLCDYMKELCKLDLSIFSWAQRELCNCLISLLINIYFGLDGMDRVWYDYENQAFKSPVAVSLASVASGYLQERLNISLSTLLLSQLSTFIFKAISMTEYDIRRQNLLLVNSNGLGLNKITKNRILKRYEPLVASFTFVELYEIRGLDQNKYDAVLMDSGEMAYNYSLPCCVIHILNCEKEMDILFNRCLIKAYQKEDLILPASRIEINRGYLYTDELQFLQFLAFRHGKTSKDREQIKNYLQTTCFHHTGFLPAKLVVLYLPFHFCNEECMELYCLDTPGTWKEREIEFLLFFSVDWKNDWKKVKAMENCIRQLSFDYTNTESFSRKGRPVLLDMIERCIKYE